VKITNTGKRAFIVKAKSVVKGGEKIEKTDDVAINPGETVEVTEECGKVLERYSDIKVMERGKKSRG
jgi:hypothetical protein